jgi:hypothetical protein
MTLETESVGCPRCGLFNKLFHSLKVSDFCISFHESTHIQRHPPLYTDEQGGFPKEGGGFLSWPCLGEGSIPRSRGD